MGNPERILVALGGNALAPPGTAPTLRSQHTAARGAMSELVPFVARGMELVVTHGNGFQVGSILLRVEEALGKAYELPLEVCVAESQGEIAYLLEQSLQNELAACDLRRPVVSVLTQVLVDPRDPAFAHPTKPVGPRYDDEAAERLRASGMTLAAVPGGWRRVVPSPRPVAIDDVEVIGWLLGRGAVVIAAGGGGVPVVERTVEGKRRLEGVAAVIDKDLASSLLARAVDASTLLIVTGVSAACRDFGSPAQEELRRLAAGEARALAEEGHFAPGSMLPKIEAACEFVEAGGARAVICGLGRVADALAGQDGTTITA